MNGPLTHPQPRTILPAPGKWSKQRRIGGFSGAVCRETESICGKLWAVCDFARPPDDSSGRVRGKTGVVCRQTPVIRGNSGAICDESGPVGDGTRAVCLRGEVVG